MLMYLMKLLAIVERVFHVLLKCKSPHGFV